MRRLAVTAALLALPILTTGCNTDCTQLKTGETICSIPELTSGGGGGGGGGGW
jgi:hypothetical protein